MLSRNVENWLELYPTTNYAWLKMSTCFNLAFKFRIRKNYTDNKNIVGYKYIRQRLKEIAECIEKTEIAIKKKKK